MPDPINMVPRILLRIHTPPSGEGEVESPVKPTQIEPGPSSSPPPLRMEGPEQTVLLRSGDAGWRTPPLTLPKKGVLKIRLPLPGERLTLFHPISPQSGTELIPLPGAAASQGELWLVRLPEQQFLLLWLPFGIPPCPLNQLQLGLQASTTGGSASLNPPQALLVRQALRIGILLFILCVLLTLL